MGWRAFTSESSSPIASREQGYSLRAGSGPVMRPQQWERAGDDAEREDQHAGALNLQVGDRRAIIRVGSAPGRGGVSVVAQAAPYVGRDADLRQFKAALARACEGAGSIVVIPGEAGIGKTRLCAELSVWHRQRGGRVLLGRAAPQEASIPYAALADALRDARRAEPAVWAAARARAGILWAVAPELAPEAGGPGRSADRPVLFEALLDAVDEAAEDGTVLWVLDDLHWADDSTLEFVRYAARRVADMALVLAVTYREEEIGPAHPWWPGLVQVVNMAASGTMPGPRCCAMNWASAGSSRSAPAAPGRAA